MIRELSEVEMLMVGGGFVTVNGVDYTEDEWNSLFNVPTGTSYGQTDIFSGMLGYNSAMNSFAYSSSVFAQQVSSWSAQQSAIDRYQAQIASSGVFDSIVGTQIPLMLTFPDFSLNPNLICRDDSAFSSVLGGTGVFNQIRAMTELTWNTGSEYGFIFNPATNQIGPLFTSGKINIINTTDWLQANGASMTPQTLLAGQYIFHTHPSGSYNSPSDLRVGVTYQLNVAAVSASYTNLGYVDCYRPQ